MLPNLGRLRFIRMHWTGMWCGSNAVRSFCENSGETISYPDCKGALKILFGGFSGDSQNPPKIFPKNPAKGVGRTNPYCATCLDQNKVLFICGFKTNYL